MRIYNSTFHLSDVAVRSNISTPAPIGSRIADSGKPRSGAVSKYDFTNMSPSQMQDTMGGLIRSGRMSVDDSSSLVGMIPTALAWAGSAAPTAGQLSAAINKPMDFLATLRAGINGAQSRGDAQDAATLTRTLNVLEHLQGTTASADLLA